MKPPTKRQVAAIAVMLGWDPEVRAFIYETYLDKRDRRHVGFILEVHCTSGGTTKRDPRKDRTMVAKAKKTAKKASKRTTKSPKAAAGKTAKKPVKKSKK